MFNISHVSCSEFNLKILKEIFLWNVNDHITCHKRTPVGFNDFEFEITNKVSRWNYDVHELTSCRQVSFTESVLYKMFHHVVSICDVKYVEIQYICYSRNKVLLLLLLLLLLVNVMLILKTMVTERDSLSLIFIYQ